MVNSYSVVMLVAEFDHHFETAFARITCFHFRVLVAVAIDGVVCVIVSIDHQFEQHFKSCYIMCTFILCRVMVNPMLRYRPWCAQPCDTLGCIA